LSVKTKKGEKKMTKKEITEMIQKEAMEAFNKNMAYSLEASTETDPARREMLNREELINFRLLVVLQGFIDCIDSKTKRR
jgi:hypothetical protein